MQVLPDDAYRKAEMHKTAASMIIHNDLTSMTFELAKFYGYMMIAEQAFRHFF